MMDLVDKVTPDGWYESQRREFRNVIESKNHWYDLIMKVYELDPGVRNAFFRNFILNTSLLGSDTQEETARREGPFCWIPPAPAICTAPAAGWQNTATV